MRNKIKYFIRDYKLDLLTAFVSLMLVLIASYLGPNQKVALMSSAIIIFIGSGIIIYLRSKNKDFYFIALDNRANKDEWMGNGQFEYSRANKCFFVTQSEAGYIFSKCLNWSDYKLSFQFKVRKKCLGILLRAINLSNYIMLQITPEGIKPHIRITGAWNAAEAKDVGLVFENKLSLENWYRCELICDKNIVYIKIFSGKKIILDREWKIAQGNIQFEYPGKDGNPVIAPPFPINVDYGSIGFRNTDDEKALIKNILVEKM